MLPHHSVSWPLTPQKYCTVYFRLTSPYPRNLGLLLMTVFIGMPLLEHPHTLVLWRSSLVLTSDQCWGFLSGLIPSAFLPKFFFVYFLYPMCDRYMFCPVHSLDLCHPNYVCWIAQIMKLIIQVAPDPYPIVLLNVLEHPLGMLFA
jgi:hypothetical protein